MIPFNVQPHVVCAISCARSFNVRSSNVGLVDQILYFHKIIETDFNDITGAWLLFEVLPDVIIVSSK